MRFVSLWAIPTVGLGLLVAAAVDLTLDDGGTALVALVVAGALLLLAPQLLPRLERLVVGASGVELTLAGELARHGAPTTAKLVQQSGLAAHIDAYATAHDELTSPEHRKAKIHLQDRIIDRAAATARRQKFDADEVRRLFADGSPTARVLVLGLMTGDPSLADVDSIASAIGYSRSGNEQYHALRLAQLRWDRLADKDRDRLTRVITSDPLIPESPRRRGLAEQLVGPLPTTAG